MDYDAGEMYKRKQTAEVVLAVLDAASVTVANARMDVLGGIMGTDKLLKELAEAKRELRGVIARDGA